MGSLTRMTIKDTIAWLAIMLYITILSNESYWYWEEKESMGKKRENENHRVIYFWKHHTKQ